MKNYLFILAGLLFLISSCTSGANEKISLEDLATKEIAEESKEEKIEDLEKDLESNNEQLEMANKKFMLRTFASEAKIELETGRVEQEMINSGFLHGNSQSLIRKL